MSSVDSHLNHANFPCSFRLKSRFLHDAHSCWSGVHFDWNRVSWVLKHRIPFGIGWKHYAHAMKSLKHSFSWLESAGVEEKTLTTTQINNIQTCSKQICFKINRLTISPIPWSVSTYNEEKFIQFNKCAEHINQLFLACHVFFLPRAMETKLLFGNCARNMNVFQFLTGLEIWLNMSIVTPFLFIFTSSFGPYPREWYKKNCRNTT